MRHSFAAPATIVFAFAVPFVVATSLDVGAARGQSSSQPSDQATVSTTDGERLFQCQKQKGRVHVEFKPALELAELVHWASAFSCEAILYSSQVGTRKLSVNIIAPKKMSGRSAWSLFFTALRAMNLTMVKKGGAYVVVEAAQAKGHALPLLRGKVTSRKGLARTLISAEHIDGPELASVVKALSSKDGEVTALAGSNMVLVTDYTDHIARMSELLGEIDRNHAASEGVYVVPVVHADVAELATTIEAILGAEAKTAAPSRPVTRKGGKTRALSPATSKSTTGLTAIIAEPRTKSLILVASKAAYSRARALVKRLDIETGEQTSHIHMVDLEHADAEAMAATINALVSARSQSTPARASGRTAANATPTRAPAGSLTLDGDVRVTHDAPSNSLLVLATSRDFLSLREIIRRLDSTRPQVYIEAMIMEVSVTGDRDLGGSFHFGGEHSGGTWLAGLQQDELKSTSVETLVGATGLLGGLFGPSLDGLEALTGQSIPSYGVLFQAIATSRRANLLSSPRIMTSDNTEATIKISERRREQGNTTTVATGGTTQAVETVDASLILKVTPHVNSGGEVRLEIELVIEEFLPSRSGALGSDTSSREITNTVVVQDQESVVIGGLMVEREVKTERKVPLLGDVPILGYLFKSTGHDKEKRNLVVLLTPYVLDSRADHNHIVRETLSKRAEFMRAHLNLKDAAPRPNVDYRKKRGLLEAINQRAKQIELDKRALETNANQESSTSGSEGPL